MRARRRTLELDPDELAATLARTRAGFHRAVAGMAQAGNDLVVDYVLSEQWRLLGCLTVFSGLDVVFIGVRCSEQELARRERRAATGTPDRQQPNSGRSTPTALMTSNATRPQPAPATAP